MSRSQQYYLDHNATTPCLPEVVEAMLPFFSHDFGNPASPHAFGRTAARALEKARLTVSAFVGALEEEIVFTSGATEGNTSVLTGLNDFYSDRRCIVVGAGEHKSVLEPSLQLEKQGFKVTRIPLDQNGLVDLALAERIIDKSTLLVSVQAANNETGTLQPVSEISKLARRVGAFVHCDIAQAVGKIKVSLEKWDIDFASASGHKMYGPKGIGFNYIRTGKPALALRPLILGGGQERGMRSGTVNLPSIVGLARACEILENSLSLDIERISDLRDFFERLLLDASIKCHVVAKEAARLPGTCCVILPGVPADLVISKANDLALSMGSACTSGTISPSHVLLACGYSREQAGCALRVSFGRSSSREDAEYASKRILSIAENFLEQVTPSYSAES
jgi:cysteine desulfurase